MIYSWAVVDSVTSKGVWVGVERYEDDAIKAVQELVGREINELSGEDEDFAWRIEKHESCPCGQ